ncbi:MAG: hypothetical protein ACLFR0_05450 [Alphaproteobacteria bacterium]
MGGVINLKDVNGPVVDDVSGDNKTLDMAEQPEIVHAALTALESMDIPNGQISAYEYEGTIHLNNLMKAYEDGSGSVELVDGSVIENSQMHMIGLQVEIDELENGNYGIDVRADHMGSYEQGEIDARTTLMNYEVTPEGEFLDRSGHAVAHDDAANQWTIEAAQAFEYKLATILGENSLESLVDKRPETAVTDVGEPPIDATLNSLQELSQKLGSDNQPAVPQQSFDAFGPQ